LPQADDLRAFAIPAAILVRVVDLLGRSCTAPLVLYTSLGNGFVGRTLVLYILGGEDQTTAAETIKQPMTRT
jgi:hypothetical protein